MSNFTPLVHFEIEFDGDTVSMDLRRMQRKDQQKLVPFMSGDIREDGSRIMSFQSQHEMGEAMLDILPDHVSNFAGLTMPDGTAIALETAIEEIYFQELIADILAELMRISNVGDVERKK